MDLSVDRNSSVPIYRQIARGIGGMILAGKLPDGFLLPPERRLANTLNVNRSTVLSAYRELKADGLVEARVGQGTRVVGTRRPAAMIGPVQSVPWRQLTRAAEVRAQDPLVRDLLDLTADGGAIPLSVGLPAAELLPLDAFRSLQAQLAEEVGPPLVLHCPTEGLPRLRESLATAMLSRGIRCSAQEVVVTSGSQQGLDLIARVFVDPGDAVVVEEPSFFGALQVFRRAGARLVGVPTDADGMRVEMLEALLQRQRPKLIYTLPTFQNPGGMSLPLERRQRLLEVAARYQVPVVEDDLYSDLRYEGEPAPALRAIDQRDQVIYLSSFSKVCFPGPRVGWVIAPRQVVRMLVLAKQAVDLHSNTGGQWFFDAFLRQGHYAGHLRRLRPAYHRRRDDLLAGLASARELGASWDVPAGGFYVWGRLPDEVAQTRLLAQASAVGVAYLPGDACFAGEPPGGFFRLNFTYAPAEQVREGAERFVEALRRALAEPRSVRRAAGGTPPIV